MSRALPLKTARNLLIALAALILSASIVGCIGGSASSDDNAINPASTGNPPAGSCRLILNGQESSISESQLFEKNGQLMIVARPILEELGAQVYWDPLYRTLLAAYQEHNVSFYGYSGYYTYDSIENVNEAQAEIVEGELAVPAELCFGALGGHISWDRSGKTLSIDMPPEPDTSHLQAMASSGVEVQTVLHDSAAIADILSAHCQAGVLPAMGGAIVMDDGTIYLAVSGVRKVDDPTPAASGDLWHMGSCTKAMTATMIAYLIEKGDLRWDLTMAEAFPQYASIMDSEHGAINIHQLLTHTAGFPRDADWSQFERDFTPGLDAASSRLLQVRQAATIYLEYPPGQGYLYSNLDYVVAASMAEQAQNARWEDLMTELVFKPLGISDMSYAGTGTPGQVDQPWPHDTYRQATAYNGSFGDPYAMFAGPCGYAHLSLESWGKFVIDQMRGLQGKPALLQTASYQQLVTPGAANPAYAHGWEILAPASDGSPCYGHSGSNSLNTCAVRMYPGRGYAVLVTTNAGDTFGVAPDMYPPVHDILQDAALELISLAESGQVQRANH